MEARIAQKTGKLSKCGTHRWCVGVGVIGIHGVVCAVEVCSQHYCVQGPAPHDGGHAEELSNIVVQQLIHLHPTQLRFEIESLTHRNTAVILQTCCLLWTLEHVLSLLLIRQNRNWRQCQQKAVSVAGNK